MATAGATFTGGRVKDNNPEVSHYRVVRKVPYNGTIPYDDFHIDDIALLQVEYLRGDFKPINICLPGGEVVDDDTTCYAIGWGLTSVGGFTADVLQEVELPIENINTCVSKYAEFTTRPVIPKQNICAGSSSGGKDACTGDSGGPLMCQRKSSCSWFLAGVVSWGYSCGQTYGVYTNVVNYEEWINGEFLFWNWIVFTNFLQECLISLQKMTM